MNHEIDPQLNDLAEKTIGAAIEVHRYFGPGFSEVTYHKAMLIELADRGIRCESESPVELIYKCQTVGTGRIDILVEGALVLELKSCAARPEIYKKQVLTYLKATGLRLGLILNFETEMLKNGIGRVVN